MNMVIPVIAMTTLGLIFGLGLAYTLRLFGVEVDPTVALIITKLPGANCGACGKAGCAGFAEALKKGEAVPAGCAVTSDEARKAIAQILGIDYNSKIKTIATLICKGSKNAKDKFVYSGIKSCKAATLVFGGYKACKYACLGFGDCERVCPFLAIKIGDDNLPHINNEKCTGCGKCVQICPKAVLVLTPQKKNYHIECNSKDKGPQVMKACKVGCIACGKCAKSCPVNAIFIEDNLAKIDYNKCSNCGECFKVCPTHAIGKRRN
ncbi:MAG: RnfABCDGE type electron transport complex subunit B [Candidatus Omnitrophica bacterium]|nr:RnfABCDGE type electron transport complex subunit B [Candidatus Omnitrophota bacterium]